mmetsp:Transcript_33718/g.86388  ORF Transcript_33718/g.86388 Transcript_33718/m.86388 type:complete len:92 (+) Transcript_33718:68-343(+)
MLLVACGDEKVASGERTGEPCGRGVCMLGIEGDPGAPPSTNAILLSGGRGGVAGRGNPLLRRLLLELPPAGSVDGGGVETPTQNSTQNPSG